MNPTFVHEILGDLIALHGPSIQPWLSKRERLVEQLGGRGIEESQGLKEYLSMFVNQRRDYSVQDGVAIIHANDALARNTTPIDRALGMTDYAELIAELDQAAADPAVAGILVDIASPGGSAVGAPEAAAALARAAQQKPVVSYIESIGASAAYYFAAASQATLASQSAIVGSIGTIMSFVDYGQMLAKIGITPHVFTPEASDLKATGTPMRAPTAAESAFLQSRAETLNAAFVSWVQTHRPAATADSMRGQWFTGTEALSRALVDQVGTRSDAMGALRALVAFDTRAAAK
jgi:signal peptide peptidase SppA